MMERIMDKKTIFLMITCLTASKALSNFATHSFSNDSHGSHPFTLILTGSEILVNLEALSGASVSRARLDLGYEFIDYDLSRNRLPSKTTRIQWNGIDQELSPPRYRCIDVTEAVQTVLNSGQNSISFQVIERGIALGGLGERVSLNVWCNLPLTLSYEAVGLVEAVSRKGDTQIVFDEPDSELSTNQVTLGDYLNFLDENAEWCYRIYRSLSPINQASDLLQADLIDEIPPLSGWNAMELGPTYYGSESRELHMLPVDHDLPAERGKGIYVRTQMNSPEETAYYYVSRVHWGEEDWSQLSLGSNVTGAVSESNGPGLVLRSRQVFTEDFLYEGPTDLNYYVRWEKPPRTSNFPNSPQTYLVAKNRNHPVQNPGIDLGLHAWGGNLNHDYGWWYNGSRGYLLVAGNQIPFEDWWCGYHQNLGTLKSVNAGCVKPYTPHRILSFVLDFVVPEYLADPRKIILAGSSMGGSGTSSIGMRHGSYFSQLIGWVGIHIPSQSPTFTASYEKCWGNTEWKACFSNQEFYDRFGGELIRAEDHISVWDYYDDTWFLLEFPEKYYTWHTFSNGSNDEGIGWEQARLTIQAYQNATIPFNVQWGTNGHGQRVQLPDPVNPDFESDRTSHLEFRSDHSYPGFVNSQADNDFWAEAEGKINCYFSWNESSIQETSNSWSCDLFIPDWVAHTNIEVDVFPCNLQLLQLQPDMTVHWQLSETGMLLQEGNSRVPSTGKLIVSSIVLSKNTRTLYFEVIDSGCDEPLTAVHISAPFSSQGLNLADFEASMTCFDLNWQVQWSIHPNLNYEAQGNQMTLLEWAPSGVYDISCTVTDPDTLITSYDQLIFLSAWSSRFHDFNGDSVNNERDLFQAITFWRQAFPQDANHDGTMDVRDLLYIPN
jgi:hypothetical protein